MSRRKVGRTPLNRLFLVALWLKRFTRPQALKRDDGVDDDGDDDDDDDDEEDNDDDGGGGVDAALAAAAEDDVELIFKTISL